MQRATWSAATSTGYPPRSPHLTGSEPTTRTRPRRAQSILPRSPLCRRPKSLRARRLRTRRKGREIRVHLEQPLQGAGLPDSRRRADRFWRTHRACLLVRQLDRTPARRVDHLDRAAAGRAKPAHPRFRSKAGTQPPSPLHPQLPLQQNKRHAWQGHPKARGRRRSASSAA